jgi:hypothetical protein
MKWNFLYQITAASRTSDERTTAPRSPSSLSSVLNSICWPPPPEQNSWVRHCRPGQQPFLFTQTLGHNKALFRWVLGVKWPLCERDLLHQYTTKVKNAWSDTSTPHTSLLRSAWLSAGKTSYNAIIFIHLVISNYFCHSLPGKGKGFPHPSHESIRVGGRRITLFLPSLGTIWRWAVTCTP